jgi:S1-C subfamily serine protease
MTTEIAGALGLKEAKGILVTEVTSASPAHNAGIRGGNVVTNINGGEIVLGGGDIILTIDNKTFSTINDLHSYLNTKKVGDTAQLTIARENTVKSISF